MAFATASDVATRLGRALTDDETDQATAAIVTVTGLIVEAVYQDDAWAAALDPVPTTLSTICIEKAISVIANPTNIASGSETLGAHQVSQTYPRSSDVGVFLSAGERTRARRAVYGSQITDVRTPTELEDFLEDALGS